MLLCGDEIGWRKACMVASPPVGDPLCRSRPPGLTIALQTNVHAALRVFWLSRVLRRRPLRTRQRSLFRLCTARWRCLYWRKKKGFRPE